MIRTFEELFEKMKFRGCDLHRLKGVYEEVLHWREQYRQSSGTARTVALIQQDMYRNNMMGYLSCLLDTGHICQSEYDQLWNSLDVD